MSDKKVIILHIDTLSIAIDSLTQQQLGELLVAAYEYHKGIEHVFQDQIVELMFKVFVNSFRIDHDRYAELCQKRTEAINKRWQAHKEEEPPTPPPKQKSVCHADYDWVEDAYKIAWSQWLDFKRANKQSYKTEQSLKTAYNQWKSKANNDPLVAQEIVTESIANNYAGLFPLKNTNNGYNLTRQQRNQQVAEALARQCASDFAAENEGESISHAIQL